MAIESVYQNAVESRTSGYMPVFGQKKGEVAASSFSQALSETSKSGTADSAREEKDPGGFLAFLFGILDVINPLQHIPVVSTIYRHITGDEISPMARIAGDALYGGPIGAAVAVANVVVEEASGKDIGENMLAMVTGDKADGATMLASNVSNIQPSSGAMQNEIIWDEPAVSVAQAAPSRNELSLPSSSLPPSMAKTAELKPAAYSCKEQLPVSSLKGRLSVDAFLTAACGTGEEIPAITGVLHPQETPADMPEIGVPPELISYKMAEALDKYAAMKRTGL